MPNELVFDDREFLGGGRFEHMTPGNYADLFSQTVWEGSANDTNLYRPLLLVSFGLQSALFGDWLAGFHLFNVLLHILATLLVFGLVREVLLRFETEPDPAGRGALMAAMVFAVHPAFSEVVNSVFNGSEIYITIAAAGGLWHLLRTHRARPWVAWLTLGVIYFCALLFRESAISIPALAVILLWFTGRDHWRARLRQCLPVLLLVLPLALYFGMRSQAIDALAPPSGAVVSSSLLSGEPVDNITGVIDSAAPTDESLLSAFRFRFDEARVRKAVPMWFDALKFMVWPHPLIVLHEVSTTPFWLALLTQVLLMAYALYLLARSRPTLITGLAYFYTAILPASRIISESNVWPLLLERMLYLPSIGLVIILAAGLAWLAGRRPAWVSAALVLPVVLLFTVLTWNRNQDWSDELRLVEGDFNKLPSDGQLLYSAIKANARAGKLARSAALCSKHAGMVGASTFTSMECAKVNGLLGRHREAEFLFQQALDIDPGNSHAHFLQARMLAGLGRWNEAQEQFDEAVRKERKPFLREFMTAIMLIELHPGDRDRLLEAKTHLETSLRLQPRFAATDAALTALNRKLGTGKR